MWIRDLNLLSSSGNVIIRYYNVLPVYLLIKPEFFKIKVRLMDSRIPTLANGYVQTRTIVPVQNRLLADQFPNVRYEKLLRLFLLHIFEF